MNQLFDSDSARRLQSVPRLAGISPDDIPRILTEYYAELVSNRLRGSDTDYHLEQSTLRIAQVYELVASLGVSDSLRKSAAFVAGTGHHIIARRFGMEAVRGADSILTRDSLSSAAASTLLFLIAEQYADATEASRSILYATGTGALAYLSNNIKDLGQGQLLSIVHRVSTRGNIEMVGSLEDQAFQHLALAIADAVGLLASDLLSTTNPSQQPPSVNRARESLHGLLNLSQYIDAADSESPAIHSSYNGPAHLITLLLSLCDSLPQAALAKLSAPVGASIEWWTKWLYSRARRTPYVWENHRQAISSGFLDTGKSAVLVLPTGAGKTTISSLKIAGVLARGKKVVFLAPTHALVEQLTGDLQAIFPADLLGASVSGEFDSLYDSGQEVRNIEVMTPERCLAVLSLAPEAFSDVALLVFDECHMLSPESHGIGRSLDSMLCLMAFLVAVPEADILLMSAMLSNAPELADWIQTLTQRPCVSVEIQWKPSRQARGVVVYRQGEIEAIRRRAWQVQTDLNIASGINAMGVRAAAARELKATPYVLWGLQHNWAAFGSASTAVTTIDNEKVVLNGRNLSDSIRVTPNANKVAAEIAFNASESGMKTIVFVTTRKHSASTARDIAERQKGAVQLNDEESKLYESITEELGSSNWSIIDWANLSAVPHNALMLYHERLIAEHLFRRVDGASVIVATPTLAQGLNLPAHLAILAGDKRMSQSADSREALASHELLNAAARAGRAGHVANGVVLLIPEPIIQFADTERLSPQTLEKLESILPEDERCVELQDPLDVVLDRIMAGEVDDKEVRYTVNRMATIVANSQETAENDFISRSFGAFIAAKAGAQEHHRAKRLQLWRLAELALHDEPGAATVLIASQTGWSLAVLEQLRVRLIADAGTLPITIAGWVGWVFDWLAADLATTNELLGDSKRSALAATGRRSDELVDAEVLGLLHSGVLEWIAGSPYGVIEKVLAGGNEVRNDHCECARELSLGFIPRGLAYTTAIIARMIVELDLIGQQPDLTELVVLNLASAVRKGYDSVEKLQFARDAKGLPSRVQLHRMYLGGGSNH